MGQPQYTCSPTNANLLTWPQLKRGASQGLRQVRAVLQAYIDEMHMALKPSAGRTHAGIACTPQDATLLSGMCCSKMMTWLSAKHARGLKSSAQGSCAGMPCIPQDASHDMDEIRKGNNMVCACLCCACTRPLVNGGYVEMPCTPQLTSATSRTQTINLAFLPVPSYSAGARLALCAPTLGSHVLGL